MELKISDLTKEFDGFKAVSSVSCSMQNGVYGLLGTNGAGKTTLMRMLTTLLTPTSGNITWDGENIFEMDGRYRTLLGYLPQDFGFYPDFTVHDYLMYIASIKGIRPSAAKQRIKELLKQVGLTNAAKKKMKTLSGGMKRRAGIAQAMLNDPKILILDEPTAGLDPSERIRFRNLISELSGDRIVLLSTHIVSDIEYIAKEIFLMKDGRIILSGTSEKLIASMPEKVWSCTVPRDQIDGFLNMYRVANIRTLSGAAQTENSSAPLGAAQPQNNIASPQSPGAQLRIVSAQPPTADAVLETPALEDVFLYHFGERTGKDDGEI